MRRNPILDSDSYKLCHSLLYPKGLEGLHSYFASRSKGKELAFFGVQGFVRDVLMTPITSEDVEEAALFARRHGLPFDMDGWRIILEDYAGYFPVIVSSVDEGTVLPSDNAVLTVESTDPRVPWVTTFIESKLVSHMWTSMSVATRELKLKRMMKRYWSQTADGFGGFSQSLVDFGRRGATGHDGACIAGAAHLAFFESSDNMSAVRYVNTHYDDLMSGVSIAATEHSVQCAWGRKLEKVSFEAYLRRISASSARPAVSIVGDTWDVFKAAEMIAELAPLAHALGITVVFRPDSGDASNIVPPLLDTLAKGFGWDTNKKGFKLLRDARLIWGDGIDERSAHLPLLAAVSQGYSAANVLLGSGGGLLQKGLDRDLHKFAFKASASRQKGAWSAMSKDPITDPGKRSKLGRQALVNFEGEYRTVSYLRDEDRPQDDLLLPRYVNGALANPTNIRAIADRFNTYL